MNSESQKAENKATILHDSIELEMSLNLCTDECCSRDM